jgi:hypothetical protein
MSEQSSYTTEIRVNYAENVSLEANIEANPSMKILWKAVRLAAEDIGGEVTDRIVDCDGKETRCLMAIKAKEYPRGVGITIEGGRVVYRYDAYGEGAGWGKRIAAAVNQNYTTVAVLMVQEKLGYKVEVRKAEGVGGRKCVVVTGRK